MSTYLIKTEKKITRQEANDFDVVFIVPVEFQLTGAVVNFLVVTNDLKTKIIEKTSSAGIAIVGQRIEITVGAADTVDKSGLFKWELNVTIASKNTTIGRGQFEILKSYKHA